MNITYILGFDWCLTFTLFQLTTILSEKPSNVFFQFEFLICLRMFLWSFDLNVADLHLFKLVVSLLRSFWYRFFRFRLVLWTNRHGAFVELKISVNPNKNICTKICREISNFLATFLIGHSIIYARDTLSMPD